MEEKKDIGIFSYCFNKIMNNQLGVYAGQASFFMILSLFPIILLFFNIIGYTSLPKSLISNIINDYCPDMIKPFLIDIVKQLQNHASGAGISLSAIFAVWSASKGSLAIIYGTRNIMESKKTLNYFALRALSIVYTLILIFAIVLTLVLLVFGNSIFNYLRENFAFLNNFTPLYSIGRYAIVMLLLTLFFLSIYKLGGDKDVRIIDHLPGAMFTSIGWLIYSYLFSLYVENFGNFSYMYGSLTALFIIMLWIYFCMYIMFLGAVINRYIYIKDPH